MQNNRVSLSSTTETEAMQNEIEAIWAGYLRVKALAFECFGRREITHAEYKVFVKAAFNHALAREDVARVRHA